MVALGHFHPREFLDLDHLSLLPMLVAMVTLDFLVLGWFRLEARMCPLAILYLPQKLGFPAWMVTEGPFLQVLVVFFFFLVNRWAKYFHSGSGELKLVFLPGLTVSKKLSCFTWYWGRFQVLNMIAIFVWLCLLVTDCPICTLDNQTCGSGTGLVLCSLVQIVQLVLFSYLEME